MDVDMHVLFLIHTYMFMHMLWRISERLIVGITYSLKKKTHTQYHTHAYKKYTKAPTNIHIYVTPW